LRNELIAHYRQRFSAIFSAELNSINFQNTDKDGQENKSIKNAETSQLRLYCVSNCALSTMPKVRWGRYSNGSKLEWFNYFDK